MRICATAWSIAPLASLSDFPGARLNDSVVATNCSWWFTASGVLPGPYLVNAASGTIVSLLVLTAAPLEAPPLPVLAIALVAALRAELPATLAAVADAFFPDTVPTSRFDDSVPEA